MSSKKHIISYESSVNTYPDILVPVKKLVPKWYKEIPLFNNNELVDGENRRIAKTVKHCTPLLDSLTTGYVITLPCDIAVGRDKNNNAIFLSTNLGPPLVTNRMTAYNPKELSPTEYDSVSVSWSLPAAISVPPGFSFIFTHPLNRFDLPFTTLSGIVDGGFVLNAFGNAPFYLKKNFEGIIEKGTPIAQIIPFQHSRWIAEEKKGLIKLGEDHLENMRSKITNGWYKKTWWTKKEYN